MYRNIHQIWLPREPGQPVPQQIRNYVVTWIINNPTFNHRLWGEEVFEMFGGRETFDKIYDTRNAPPAALTDILRVLLVYKYGGVYADCDSVCHKSIEPLLLNRRDFFYYSDLNAKGKRSVHTDFFYLEKEHPILYCVDADIINGSRIRTAYVWKYGFRVLQKHALEYCELLQENLTKEYFTHLEMNSWFKGLSPFDFSEEDR